MKTMLRKFSASEGAKLAFFLFVLVATGIVFIKTPTLFPSALLSVLLFFIFSPIIDSFERKGIPRGSAITGVFLICGMVLAGAATWLTPRISLEIESFQRGSARYSSSVTERLQQHEESLREALPMFKDSNLTERGLEWLRKSIDKMWSVAPNFASHFLIALLLVPFFTFVLLKDAHEIRRSILKLVPNRYFETVYGLVARILDEMGGYVAARIIEAILVAALVTIGCLIFGIPYAVLLGVFAGATNAIPYLGPLIGALPGILLAVLEPAVPNHLFWVSMIYIFANVIDMVLIFPLVVAKIVDLHPIVVVISVILGSQVFGIVGMIVAVPITSILKIFIQELYSRVYNHNDAHDSAS